MTKNQIGQYFNIDGVYLNLKYIFRLHKLKPDIKAKSIMDLDLPRIKSAFKVKYVVFDKDNTLTLPHENCFANEEIKEKIEEFRSEFGNANLAILSNSAGSRDDKGHKEALAIESQLRLQVIRHDYKKPRVYKEIFMTFNNEDNFDKKEVCIIGDRLLVDVLLGKEYGFTTILVDPITKSKDNFVVRILRKLENALL